MNFTFPIVTDHPLWASVSVLRQTVTIAGTGERFGVWFRLNTNLMPGWMNGKRAYASAWIRHSKTVPVNIKMEKVQAGGTFHGDTKVCNAGEWQHFTIGPFTITEPADTNHYTCTFYTDGYFDWEVGDYMDITGMLFCEAPRVVSGSISVAQNWRWQGAANESESYGYPRLL